MRTIETTVYKFEELSEPTRDKIIQDFYDINVDYGWWLYIYYDAENAGLRITGFDIDRGAHCAMEFIDSAEAAAELIIKNHGHQCDTHRIALRYTTAHAALSPDQQEDLSEDMSKEFSEELAGAYLSLLRQAYKYLTSEEAIADTIRANDCEFTAEGRLI